MRRELGPEIFSARIKDMEIDAGINKNLYVSVGKSHDYLFSQFQYACKAGSKHYYKINVQKTK